MIVAVAAQQGSKRQKRLKTGNPSLESERSLQQGPAPKPRPRYVKGRQGHLKQMVEMPLDTLHEIFRELEPIDLLHLSWASKDLNVILMERASRYIWEEAFERLYGTDKPPPRCPDDLNLAQYARLLFEKKCFVCGIAHGHWCSWLLQLRACIKCITGSGEFIPEKECDISGESYLLPIRANNVNFYLKAEYLKMKERFDHNKWRIKQARIKQYFAFKRWESYGSMDKHQDLLDRRAERKAAVIEKLREIGWEESDIEKVVDRYTTKPVPGLRTAKKLTNSDWEDLQPRLSKRLQDIKDVELARDEVFQLYGRWRAFRGQFECWKKEQSIELFLLPHVVDVAVCEPFKTIIFPPSLEGGDFSICEIDRVAKNWMESRDNFILSLLPEDIRATVVDESRTHTKGEPSRSLFLASLSFHHGLFRQRIDQLCGHRFDMEDLSGRVIEDHCLRDKLIAVEAEERPWDWDRYDLTFDPQHHKTAKEFVTLFGMDPKTATISEMLRCEQKFECARCSDAYSLLGMKWMDWSSAVAHEVRHHRDYDGEVKSPLGERWRRVELEDA